MDNPYITVIELNTGAGGVSLGLKKVGDFENIVTVIDNKRAFETYAKNFRRSNIVLGDIADMDFTCYQEDAIDLIWASLPAEPYAVAGYNKLDKHDPRNTIFFNYCRIIREVIPKMFVFDAIKGLYTKDDGIVYEYMCMYMEKMGYVIEEKVLNAWDYDIAQKRERLIIVGVLKSEYEYRIENDVHFKFPEPSKKKKLVLRDVIGPGLVSYDPGDCASYSKEKKLVLKLVPPGGCWIDLPDDVKIEYMGKSINQKGKQRGGKRGVAKRLSWDEPAPTLIKSPVQKQTERCHPERTRPLTVYEYKLIQSFPETYKFSGSIVDQYKQIGSSMPPMLVKCIAESIKRYIFMI